MEILQSLGSLVQCSAVFSVNTFFSFISDQTSHCGNVRDSSLVFFQCVHSRVWLRLPFVELLEISVGPFLKIPLDDSSALHKIILFLYPSVICKLAVYPQIKSQAMPKALIKSRSTTTSAIPLATQLLISS